jgi:hypothetical protein
MNFEPLVTVIVLNYKRLKELDRCLDSVLRQEWRNLEIIVVDNHSEEDVASLVRAKNSAIRLIELPENLGPCGGRNAGIRAASGQLLIMIDNDVCFLSPFEVSRAVKAFEDHPEVHVLAFRICDAPTGQLRLREWCHPRNWKEYADIEFETTFFGEGASAFRREVFDVAGLYWEPLFIGHEGYDLGLRILDHGFRILYCPRVSVGHSMSSETRAGGRNLYLYTRNYIWIAYKDYSLWGGLGYLLPKLAMMLLFSIRARRVAPWVHGVWHGVRGLHDLPRAPISSGTASYIARIERMRPAYWSRLARHRQETQL